MTGIGNATVAAATTARSSVSIGPTPSVAPTPTLSPEELEKIEYYKTYDVMTGVRIAATLGAFFGLMVIMVVCKSKSRTEKALEDPHLAAVTAAAVAEVESEIQQEEQLQLQAALEETAAYAACPRAARNARQSLGSWSAPATAAWAARHSPRFSSVGGGYDALLAPPRRMSRKSLPVQSTCGEEDDLNYLSVIVQGGDRRRCSNITCSSSDSSYLERRGSAVVGLPPPPPIPSCSGRRRSSNEHWDFYYPIDIQVIQPTPDMSPCGSGVLYDTVKAAAAAATLAPPGGLVGPQRLAPLATISSCASSLATDMPIEMDTRSSVGSDSVFLDTDPACFYDTDDEIAPFSTDSDDDDSRMIVSHSWKRRASAPVQRRKISAVQPTPLKTSESSGAIARRPPCPLPIAVSESSGTLYDEAVGGEASGLQLPVIELHDRSGSLVDVEKMNRSQETLF